MEKAGYNSVIKISGAPVSFEMEILELSGTGTRILDATKRVLDKTATIKGFAFSASLTAIAGTTTTNITATAHGLITGDMIINSTRSNAKRIITKVDNDNFTVLAVVGQTTGDTILTYKASVISNINRLNSQIPNILYSYLSGSYLPMSVAAYCNSYSKSRNCDMLDNTVFGNEYKNRIAGLKSASGTLTNINITDPIYIDALTAGLPIVIEDATSSAEEPNRFWALLENSEMASAVDGLQTETVSWISKNEWIVLGV